MEPLGLDPWTLRPRGIGRFFSAAFLVFWLAGWVVGEVFAAVVVGGGAIALLAGSPGPGREPLAWGPALAIGAFLLVWLALWTLGGFLAMRELLRLTWAEDLLTVEPDGLTIEHHLGPFRSRRHFTRE